MMVSGVVFILSPNGAAVRSPGARALGSTNRHTKLNFSPEGATEVM